MLLLTSSCLKFNLTLEDLSPLSLHTSTSENPQCVRSHSLYQNLGAFPGI